MKKNELKAIMNKSLQQARECSKAMRELNSRKMKSGAAEYREYLAEHIELGYKWHAAIKAYKEAFNDLYPSSNKY
jgi:hypothetical protein